VRRLDESRQRLELKGRGSSSSVRLPSAYDHRQDRHDRNRAPGAAELPFQVLTEREERSAIAIASNEPFSGWTKTFTDPRLCAAIVDRLTFAGQIIDTGTASYRLARARAVKAAKPA
jgi:IstB-like ATP binding protein